MHAAQNVFDQFLKTQLNVQQRTAVEHDAGPLLVIAGAGSGKTRIITARIANLILNKQVDPRSIVALTFTNKAAREMEERVIQFLAGEFPPPFIGTFHAYCLRLLKLNRALLSIPEFTIMDADDQLKIVTGILHRRGMKKKWSAKELLYQISKIKTCNALEQTNVTYDQEIVQIAQLYEQEKRASKCFDFDDLLIEVVRLFKKNKDFKTHFHQEVEHILVDEYQDTNVVQHELLKSMARDGKKIIAKSVCAVGDEDQSIYSWRGATVENIMHFKKDFAGTKTVTIEQNYRSVEPILAAANHVITHNTNRNPKHLWSEKKAHNRVHVLTCVSGYQESEFIAQAIAHAQKKHKLAQTAVLYRTHFQSRIIEEALIRQSIPYIIIGGIQFYERKEIKDILACMRLTVNPYDRVSFTRAINCPTRGLGDKFQELFLQRWEQEPLLDFVQLSKKLIKEKLIVRTKKDSLEQFINIFVSLTEGMPPISVIEAILVQSNYTQYLKNSYDKKEAEEKIDNIREFIRAVDYFQQIGTNTIRTLLEEIALMQDKIKNQKENDCVQLMTLHAAKGLEFQTVILAGLEEGLLPSSRSLYDSDALEEERRLFYVGMTRAQERLLITHARFRNTYGNVTDQMVSRFVKEIPSGLCKTDNCSNWQPSDISQFFADWFGVHISINQSQIFTFGAATKTPFTTQKKAIKENQKNIPSTKKLAQEYVHTIKKNSAWHTNQPVSHPTFGIGLVKKIEIKGKNTYVTVQFKGECKKIDAKFLKSV